MNDATQYLIDLYREFDPALIDDAPTALTVEWLAAYFLRVTANDLDVPLDFALRADYLAVARHFI